MRSSSRSATAGRFDALIAPYIQTIGVSEMKRNSKFDLWPLCFLCFISFTTNVQAECKPNLGENHTWRFSAYAKKDCIDIIGSWHEGSCVDNTWSKCYNIKTNSGVDSYMWLATNSNKIKII